MPSLKFVGKVRNFPYCIEVETFFSGDRNFKAADGYFIRVDVLLAEDEGRLRNGSSEGRLEEEFNRLPERREIGAEYAYLLARAKNMVI